MRYLLNTDKDNSTLLRHFQSEMSGIGRVVFAFLDKYTRPGIRCDETFKEEFDSIGTALTVRIESEENDLYVLYTPPSSI